MYILLLILGSGFIFFLGIFIGNTSVEVGFDVKDREDLKTLTYVVGASTVWPVIMMAFIIHHIIKYIKKIKEKRRQKFVISKLVKIYSFEIHEYTKSKSSEYLEQNLLKEILKLNLIKDKLKFKTELNDIIKLEINPSLYYIDKIKIVE